MRQEDSAARLPPPLPPSGEALKDPPKEVALLQDEETLFLDEDTLPAEVGLAAATYVEFCSESKTYVTACFRLCSC